MTRCLPAALILLTATIAHAQTSVISSAALTSSMYYDQARSRLVFAAAFGEVWEWDHQHWAKSSALLPSSAYRIHYDTTRQRAFFIGPGGSLYSFDGHTTVDHGPSPIVGGNLMVIDTRRGRLVGFRALGNAIDVYEWDGITWQPGVPIGPQRLFFAAAFDENLGVTVVTVLDLNAPTGTRTLHGDGTGWTVQSQSGPSSNTLVYDPVRRQVLSVGTTTQAWNGSNWTNLPTTAAPIPAIGFGADPAHNRLWLFDSSNPNRVWSWDGTNWSPTLDTPHPWTTEIAPGFTFDDARGRAVLFSGNGVHGEWDGTRWHRIATATTPPTRTLHGQVFDAARGETIVFGGEINASPALGDTWAYDGSNWRLAATNGPSPRSRPAMAFDSGRSRVVLVGGAPQGGGAAADHWEWDGVNWTQISAVTPIGQVLGAMGYDPVRARLALLDNLARTWEYNGTTWLQLAAGGPSSLDTYTLAWNPGSQRLAGNLRNNPAGSFRYEWDGLSWTQSGHSNGELAFDSVRGTALVYNHFDLRIESAQIASATHFGTPCGGTTTVTSLTAFGAPRPGDAALHIDLRAEAAQRPALIAFGFAPGNLPIGNGCTLLLQNPLASVVWFTDAFGFWHHPFALPNDLSLRGVSFVAQGGVLDPNSPGGLALSQGLTFVVGN